MNYNEGEGKEKIGSTFLLLLMLGLDGREDFKSLQKKGEGYGNLFCIPCIPET